MAQAKPSKVCSCNHVRTKRRLATSLCIPHPSRHVEHNWRHTLLCHIRRGQHANICNARLSFYMPQQNAASRTRRHTWQHISQGSHAHLSDACRIAVQVSLNLVQASGCVLTIMMPKAEQHDSTQKTPLALKNFLNVSVIRLSRQTMQNVWRKCLHECHILLHCPGSPASACIRAIELHSRLIHGPDPLLSQQF